MRHLSYYTVFNYFVFYVFCIRIHDLKVVLSLYIYIVSAIYSEIYCIAHKCCIKIWRVCLFDTNTLCTPLYDKGLYIPTSFFTYICDILTLLYVFQWKTIDINLIHTILKYTTLQCNPFLKLLHMRSNVIILYQSKYIFTIPNIS